MVRYRVDAGAAESHAFAVEMRIDAPFAEQKLALPVWIAGSYLVREFARHLFALTAEQADRPVAVEQLDKARWLVRCERGAPLVVRYRVHAYDASPRGAYLGSARGFFNGSALCLRAEGHAAGPHELIVAGLCCGWAIATTLEAKRGRAGASREFVAADYDALVDHPVELGCFESGRFEAAGVAHEIVVTGALPDFDMARLVADSARICAAAIAFWHGAEGKPPFDRYLFLLNAVDEGRGGLEHRSSTALVAPRRDLPARGAAKEAEPSDGYVGVLGLVAHEYFHAWNVKRLKPRELAAIDHSRENYSGLLWFFEGFTSYYDDLLLVRSGLIDAPRYLRLLATTMTSVQAAPGRFVQSVAAASFDAWVKHYRPDENTPNATVSYYAKGSLVALALDLSLRSDGHGSLDDVMRRLWQTSGGGPIGESDIADGLEAVGRRSFERELASWVHGTGELPLAELLARFGVDVERQPATLAQRLGVRVGESALTGVKVTHVLRGGAAERAGLAAGDELIAAGGWRLRRLDDALRAMRLDGETEWLVARDQKLSRIMIDAASLGGDEAGAVTLRANESADAPARARHEAWIAG